jgi:hypothetical protein
LIDEACDPIRLVNETSRPCLGGIISQRELHVPPVGPIQRGRSVIAEAFKGVESPENVEHVLDIQEIKVLGDHAFEWGSTVMACVRARVGETVRTSGKLMRILQRQPDGSVRAIRIHVAGAHRVFYLATRAEAIYVLHAFEKKTQKTSAQDLRIGRDRFRALGKLRQQHGKEKRG